MANGKKKSAIDASRFNGFYLDPDTIIMVGGDGPNDVPKSAELAHLWDKRAEWKTDPGMVQSVIEFGVEEPLIVTKIGESIYVVDGRQRLKAGREAKKTRGEDFMVPVILRRGDPAKLFGVSLTANAARLDDTPIELAEKILIYLEMGKSEEDAAKACRMTPQGVKQLLKVFELAPSVIKAVRKGDVKLNNALELIDLKPEEQVTKLEELLARGEKPTARNIRKATGKTVVPQKRTLIKLIKLETKPTIKPEYDNFWGAIMLMTGQVTAEDIGLKDVIDQLSKRAKAKPKTEDGATTTAEAMGEQPEEAGEPEAPETPEESNDDVPGTTTEELPDDNTEAPATPRPFAPAKRKSHGNKATEGAES